MKYIVCEAPGKFKLAEKKVPSFNDQEVLVGIKAIGICGTDLHAYAGNQAFFDYPRIFGHELGAEVLEVGSQVTYVKPGDKVVIMPYLSCGKCHACRVGKTNCCSSLKVLGVHVDGGMQEKITVSARLLFPVNDLDYQSLAIVEPLSIGAHAVRRANVQADETVVVVGCGPIGLGLMQLAKIKGAKVIAIDINQSRLQFAKEKIRVDHVIALTEKTLEAIVEITNGSLAQTVFDATGHKEALESGVNYMAHGGKYVLVGLYKDRLSFHHPSIHAKEASILCSRNATWTDFHEVLQMLRNGQFPVHEYITHSVPFEYMIDHFDTWLNSENGVIKAMVIL